MATVGSVTCAPGAMGCEPDFWKNYTASCKTAVLATAKAKFPDALKGADGYDALVSKKIPASLAGTVVSRFAMKFQTGTGPLEEHALTIEVVQNKKTGARELVARDQFNQWYDFGAAPPMYHL